MIRARLVGAGAACGLGIVLAGLAARPFLPLSPAFPWRSLALFAVLLAGAQTRAHTHPFPILGPANLVTLVRLALVALVLGAFGEVVNPVLAGAATAVAALAAALDGLDGRLARRTGMTSSFGARLDMDTDALLLLAMSALVWRHDKAGAWVLGIGLMRYAFVAAGLLLPWAAGPLTPTLRGRAVAALQIVALCAALAPIVPRAAGTPIAAGALAALAWSFAIDLGRLWRGASARE